MADDSSSPNGCSFLSSRVSAASESLPLVERARRSGRSGHGVGTSIWSNCMPEARSGYLCSDRRRSFSWVTCMLRSVRVNRHMSRSKLPHVSQFRSRSITDCGFPGRWCAAMMNSWCSVLDPISRALSRLRSKTPSPWSSVRSSSRHARRMRSSARVSLTDSVDQLVRLWLPRFPSHRSLSCPAARFRAGSPVPEAW